MSGNPFFETWDTPFAAPPFAAIAPEHFGPAFERGMAEHQAEIDAIADDTTEPTFDTVIAALERAGHSLRRVGGVFWNLAGADTNDSLQEIERNISPVMARHWQRINLDPRLFARVDALMAMRDRLDLTPEQARLLDLTHKGLVRSGARLGEGSASGSARSPNGWRGSARASARTSFTTKRTSCSSSTARTISPACRRASSTPPPRPPPNAACRANMR